MTTMDVSIEANEQNHFKSNDYKACKYIYIMCYCEKEKLFADILLYFFKTFIKRFQEQPSSLPAK